MKFIPFLFFLLLSIPFLSAGQTQVLKIKFDANVTESVPLPFAIKTVRMNLNHKDTLGWVLTTKKSESVALLLPSEMERMMEEYLAKRFHAVTKESEISMEITTLHILSHPQEKNTTKDSLRFGCKFFKKEKDSEELLYNFNAGSSIGVIQRPELTMQNIIKRATDAAIIQFTKSYTKIPDWSEDRSRGGINVKKHVLHNKIKGKDSIACEGKYILRAEDFLGQLPIESIQEAGVSRLGLTYSAESEESSKGIQITLSTKAYFDRSRSWRNQQGQQANWLVYQQAHFDLCTVFGNRLKDSVERHSFSAGEFRSEMNRIYNTINTEFISTRNSLAVETAKGKDIGALARWRQKIDTLLSKK